MDVEAPQAAQGPDLEDAPAERGDIRVPLEYRTPAEKRSHSPGLSPGTPGRGGKWQQFETEDRKRDRDEVAGAQSRKWQAVEDVSKAPIGPTDSLSSHPGPMIKKEDVEKCDLEWRDVGSGTVGRTFLGAKRLQVSTRGGPPAQDVYRRTV